MTSRDEILEEIRTKLREIEVLLAEVDTTETYVNAGDGPWLIYDPDHHLRFGGKHECGPAPDWNRLVDSCMPFYDLEQAKKTMKNSTAGGQLRIISLSEAKKNRG